MTWKARAKSAFKARMSPPTVMVASTAQKRAAAKVEDGEKLTVIALVTSLDDLPPEARPPAGPLLVCKKHVRAVAVGGYAVVPMRNAEPKILGLINRDDEGVVWCRGWQGDAVNAMLTVNAIQDLDP